MNFKLPTQKEKYLDHYTIFHYPETLVKDFEIENIKKNAEQTHKQ